MASMVRSVALAPELTLEFSEQGDREGVPVVLLHGFADSRRSWELVLPHLPPGLRVLTPSQRGHGDSDKPAAGYALPQLAADLGAFLDALDIPAAVIVGHSMGSAVAQRFAIDQVTRVKGLVLVGASTSLRSSPAARAYWEPIISQLSDPPDKALLRAMVEGSLMKPLPPAFRETLINESAKLPAHAWRAIFASRWRGEGDFGGQLQGISAPTMLIYGERDPRYPRPVQAALAAQITQARMLEYAGCGHSPHWEEPQRFACDLAAFIASLPFGPADCKEQ